MICIYNNNDGEKEMGTRQLELGSVNDIAVGMLDRIGHGVYFTLE